MLLLLLSGVFNEKVPADVVVDVVVVLLGGVGGGRCGLFWLLLLFVIEARLALIFPLMETMR